MPIRYIKYIVLFILCFWHFSAGAEKGPVMVNLDVPAGVWKSIRLRNLPKGSVVALEIKSDGDIMVLLVNAGDYQRFPNPRRPIFKGFVKDKLSFSVSIPESDNYFVVLDNRPGRGQRAVTVTAGAARGKSQKDSIQAADAILRRFERQLHRIFIFDAFPVGVERCDHMKAFEKSKGIVLCTGYVRQLYNTIGDVQQAKNALGFSIFHELGRILLVQWNHPMAAQKTATDEFAGVLMIMLNRKKPLSTHLKTIIQNPSISNELTKTLKDEYHSLTVERAENMLARIQDKRFVHSWQSFLVPHMQTLLLKRLQKNPTPWTDSGLVGKELARRDRRRL